MGNERILTTLADAEYSYPDTKHCVYVVPAGLELCLEEIWCIYGVSGSGKSTLMTLLASLRRLTHGTIRYRFDHDRPVDVSPEAWQQTVGPGLWRHIGFAFQRPELIQALNVTDNLRVACGDVSRDDSLFGAEEWRQVARSRVSQLSGGQVQRLGVMRAFGLGQRLVFLDEPTNNLDRSNRKELADFIRKKRHGRALVVVSHDDDFIQCLEVDHVFEIREHTVADRRLRRTLEPKGSSSPFRVRCGAAS